jgi:hypothetical protein
VECSVPRRTYCECVLVSHRCLGVRTVRACWSHRYLGANQRLPLSIENSSPTPAVIFCDLSKFSIFKLEVVSTSVVQRWRLGSVTSLCCQ